MLCHNGHDQTCYAEYWTVDGKQHRECMACVAARIVRHKEAGKASRAAKRANGYDVRCRNGHARAASTLRVAVNGQAYWTCHQCADERMARKRAKKEAKRVPS